MAPRIDPAIIKALSLDAATTTIASHGGSGFASTFKITSKSDDGKDKLYFVKQGKGKDSEVMFAGMAFQTLLLLNFQLRVSIWKDTLVPEERR
jgi:hypothetical protein